MGGCAMIGQSMININSGGRGRLSGITAAVVLLGFILFGSSLIEIIPLAALVGVMFMVVLGTFEWSSLRLLGKIPASDIFIIIAGFCCDRCHRFGNCCDCRCHCVRSCLCLEARTAYPCRHLY